MVHETEHPPLPHVLSVNLTSRCPLACPHCYLDAGTGGERSADTLTLETLAPFFRRLGERVPGLMLVLSGGEPLLRRDLEAIVAAAAAAELVVVLGTSGVGLTGARLRRLRAAGLAGIGVSLDAASPQRHDAWRGRSGAFAAAVAALEAAAALGLPAQLQVTLHPGNLSELPALVELAASCGARVVNVFFLVTAGRGARIPPFTPRGYAAALGQVLALGARERRLLVRPRCAPQVERLRRDLAGEELWTRARGYEGAGCLAGSRYARIDPAGWLTPCPYVPVRAGNILQEDFWALWTSSPVLKRLREDRRAGRCGRCGFAAACGGCRARSVAAGQGLLGEDPLCPWPPSGRPPEPSSAGPRATWTPEARRHLQRLPRFIRSWVARRLEEEAARRGEIITVEFMRAYRRGKEREWGRPFH